ncbi:MAG: FMN-binding protein [Candidatus Electryonea clarkiae]|nr:FMN-binding protein [Candidatus Electryonea clarkiae]MDP8286102.1 FMN-binding protein [Candidatus Electryonea clarkiae]
MLIVRLSVILMVIASIASGGLALLNKKTAPVIAAYKAEQQAKARLEVAEPVGGVEFREKSLEDGELFWEAFDSDSNLVGYVGMAYGKGYSSTIETVCGFDTEFRITGLKIIYQQETPGLGTKAVEVKKGETKPWFLKQFMKKLAANLAVTKDRGEIDSITGATITSRAITKSIKGVGLRIKDKVKVIDEVAVKKNESITHEPEPDNPYMKKEFKEIAE